MSIWQLNGQVYESYVYHTRRGVCALLTDIYRVGGGGIYKGFVHIFAVEFAFEKIALGFSELFLKTLLACFAEKLGYSRTCLHSRHTVIDFGKAS